MVREIAAIADIAGIARNREPISLPRRGDVEITKKLPKAGIAKESKLKTTKGAINSDDFWQFGVMAGEPRVTHSWTRANLFCSR